MTSKRQVQKQLLNQKLQPQNKNFVVFLCTRDLLNLILPLGLPPALDDDTIKERDHLWYKLTEAQNSEDSDVKSRSEFDFHWSEFPSLVFYGVRKTLMTALKKPVAAPYM